ncbi:MAG: O-antigen ligase family protein [Fibrobacter sp.]|nr:O-antigen ligase family protein [Fibrobacter sp.]
MSFVVLLFFFGLLALMFMSDTQGRFLILVMGTVLFPTTALFIKNPSISPQHIFLYAFFFIEFFKDRENFNRSIFNNLLIVPIGISVVSYLLTSIYNSGIASKDMYYGVRDIIDGFGYIYAAFICGRKVDVSEFAEKLIPFVFVICALGIFEILLGDNIPYKLINEAFPYYEGNRDLSATMSLSQSWRFRSCLTTKHPTAFGTLLMTLFLFYIPYFKKDNPQRGKILLALALLALNIFLCGSRTAMLCAAVGVCFFAFTKLGPFLKILIVGTLIFSSSAIFAAMLDRFQTNTDHGGSSLDFRTSQLLFSVASIYNSPILGNGNKYTSHVIFGEESRASDSSGNDLGGLESIVFSLLIDRGFLGLFSYYLLLLWMFVLLFRYREKLKGIRGGFALVASGTIFLTLSGTIGNSSSFLFLFTGIQLGYISQYKQIAYDNNTEVSDENDDAPVKNTEEIAAIAEEA